MSRAGRRGAYKFCRVVMEPSDEGRLPLKAFFPRFLQHTKPETETGEKERQVLPFAAAT